MGTSRPSGLHAGRTAGRHRDHRDPDRDPAAGAEPRPRAGEDGAVRQQHAADRHRDADVRQRAQAAKCVPRRLSCGGRHSRRRSQPRQPTRRVAIWNFMDLLWVQGLHQAPAAASLRHPPRRSRRCRRRRRDMHFPVDRSAASSRARTRDRADSASTTPWDFRYHYAHQYRGRPTCRDRQGNPTIAAAARRRAVLALITSAYPTWSLPEGRQDHLAETLPHRGDRSAPAVLRNSDHGNTRATSSCVTATGTASTRTQDRRQLPVRRRPRRVQPRVPQGHRRQSASSAGRPVIKDNFVQWWDHGDNGQDVY